MADLCRGEVGGSARACPSRLGALSPTAIATGRAWCRRRAVRACPRLLATDLGVSRDGRRPAAQPVCWCWRLQAAAITAMAACLRRCQACTWHAPVIPASCPHGHRSGAWHRNPARGKSAGQPACSMIAATTSDSGAQRSRLPGSRAAPVPRLHPRWQRASA